VEALTSDQRRLAADGAHRVEGVAARYARHFPSHADDIQSAALLGVIRAAGTYDDTKVWDYWVKKKAQWEICRFLKKTFKRRVPQAQFDKRMSVPDNHDYFAQVDADDAIEGLLKPLEPRTQALFRLVYLSGMAITEAAEVLRVPLRTCHRLLNEARENLKN
jgi:RNA polymerase sigma factor (sigma-70 family)